MSREKQIEEMARIIDDNHGFIVSSVETAEAIYNAGYRKQKDHFLLKENGEVVPLTKQSEGIANNATTTGEWISVDERLPEDDDSYDLVESK